MQKEKKKNYKVGVYCRVSTQEQADSGFGIDVQMSKINAYLSLFDYELENVHYYIDDGVSAKDMKRRKLQELLRDVEDEKINLLIIYKLDRLSRSVIDVYSIIEMLNRNDCNLIAVMDQLDISSANGRMMVGMLAIIAQWERETIAERTNDGLVQMAREGLFPRGGKPPFGYCRSERKLIINEEEAQLVRDVFQMAIENYNMTEIKAYLSSKGKHFEKGDSIKYLIKNKIYYGSFMYKGVYYADIVPPIISEEVFTSANDQLQKLLCKVDNEKYYFSNLIKCQSGHKLLSKSTKKPNKRYYYYVCEGCKSKRINQDAIVEEVLYRLITNSIKKDYTKQESRSFDKINSINRKIEESYENYIAGILNAKVYAYTLSQLENEKGKIIKELDFFKISNYLDWNKMTDRERKYFVQANIRELVVDITLGKLLKIDYK